MNLGTAEKCVAIIVIGVLAGIVTIITKSADIAIYAFLTIGSLTGGPSVSGTSDLVSGKLNAIKNKILPSEEK